MNAGESLSLSQEVDVPNGVYRLSMYARGDNQTNNETEMKMSATSNGQELSGNVKTMNVPGGSMFWRKYSIDQIVVEDGKLMVAFDAQTSGSYTGYIDHFVLELVDEQHPADAASLLSSLEEQLDEYISSGDVKKPLSKQLSNRVDQVKHHFEKGHSKQASKSILKTS